MAYYSILYHTIPYYSIIRETGSSLVYKTSITTKENAIPKKCYYSLCETTFKTRYNNHTHTFRDKKKQNCIDYRVSKLYWNLTSAGKKLKISWSIKKQANAYKSGTNKCQLCLAGEPKHNNKPKIGTSIKMPS